MFDAFIEFIDVFVFSSRWANGCLGCVAVILGRHSTSKGQGLVSLGFHELANSASDQLSPNGDLTVRGQESVVQKEAGNIK